MVRSESNHPFVVVVVAMLVHISLTLMAITDSSGNGQAEVEKLL